MLFLHVTTWPHMLLEYTAGQQRWIFSSCGLSNPEYLSQTRRQHALGHKRSLSHACAMLFHWLWEGICRKGHTCVCLPSPLTTRGECSLSLGCAAQKRTLDRASGWMGVWRVQVTCEVSPEEPTAKTRPVRFISSRWAKTSQAFAVFNSFFVLVFSVFNPDSRTMRCLERHEKVARPGKFISRTHTIHKAT